MKELIQIKNLSKKFGKVKALDNINLNILVKTTIATN